MSAITVKVEFIAGTSFQDAIEEAQEKAIKWDVAFVEFDFNSVNVNVCRSSNLTMLTKAYEKGLKFIV